MPDSLTALTSHAVSVFHEITEARRSTPTGYGDSSSADPVLQEAQRTTFLVPHHPQAIREILDLAFADPDLASIAPCEGELDPMLLHPGGGVRMAPSDLITSLFSSALLQMYFLRLPHEEDTFVQTVVEGFKALRRAARGERVPAYTITGWGRISLPEGRQISTPWGAIHPAPPAGSEPAMSQRNQPKTSCILAEPRLVPVKFDRTPLADHTFDAADTTPSQSRYLFPLACALASSDTSNPVAPRITWSTLLLPFQVGFSYSWPLLPRTIGAEVNLGERIADIEEWARIVDGAHVPSVDIAARRLVSAIAHRLDRSDALIDAVMVWENIVGTSNEVSFRVAAALTKLLERDPANRRARHKKLLEIYGIRSRLVHGEPIDEQKLHNASIDAIDVAVKALRISYSRGRDWLSLKSKDRSDSILLEWQ